MPGQKDDVEAQNDLLWPLLQESPELRWAFIRKVYSILTIQLLATIAFAAVFVAIMPIIGSYPISNGISVSIFVASILIPIIVICLLYFYQHKHPWNFVLLGIFTLYIGLALGMIMLVNGKVVIETVIATTVVVISLTAYTFWAAKRGQDFGFLVPLMFIILVLLFIFSIFQIFFPMEKISQILYSGIFVIVFSAYIIVDTDRLINHNSYDDYIWASVSLYLDISRIFVYMIDFFKASTTSR